MAGAELDRAVLHELSRRLNERTSSSTFDFERLLRHSDHEPGEKDELQIPEDDDWQETKQSQGSSPPPPSTSIRFYDAKWRTMYHIADAHLAPSCHEVEAYSHRTSASAMPSLKAEQQESFTPPDVEEVLGRLVPENGRLAPLGYQDWMAKKLQDRFPVETDIPGYGSLCQGCHRVLTHSLVLYEFNLEHVNTSGGNEYVYTGPQHDIFGHHENKAALQASARAGCHFCSLFSALDQEVLDSGNQDHPRPYYLSVTYSGPTLTFIHVNTVGHIDHSVCVCWAGHREIRSSTLQYSNTNALEVFRLAQIWLTRCLEEDGGTCGIPIGFVPSRLIKIAATHGSVDSAQLVLRDGLPMDIQYLTLSHCWGDLTMACLNQSTFEDYRAHIPLSMLSKTFIEALQVTAQLGYQYIWIDSLCIMQDSKLDWENEAAMMGAIYRHSTCTLAATGARDGNGGLFSERSALAFAECPLYNVEHKGQSWAVTLSTWPAPLEERAWAVQERFLSPRVISYGSDQISWVCRNTKTCEAETSLGPRSLSSFYVGPQQFSRLLNSEASEDSVDHSWKEVILVYSRCKLTYWKDKWHAFQGLASEVAKAQGWKIVHGLRYHLLSSTELLWRSSGPSLMETTDIGAPSWSWLNLQGGVTFRIGIYGPDIDADVALQESSVPTAFGEAPDGMLRIVACMVEFQSVDLGGSLMMGCTLAIKNPLFRPQEVDRLLRCHWWPDTSSDFNENLWALQITETCQVDASTREFLHGQGHEGLVVAAVNGRPGFYRRVGVYESELTDKFDPDEPCPWNGEKETIYLI